MSRRFGVADSPVEPPPRIVRKIRYVHGGHGGAWKVAFADFVTAMMALFMVLWLAGATQDTKVAVASYFDDPTGYSIRGHSGEARGGDSPPSQTDLEDLADDIREAMRAMPELGQLEKNVEISVTAEGLRIELLEDEKGVFFNSAQPSPTDRGREALLAIARQLVKLNNNLAIEGHTTPAPMGAAADILIGSSPPTGPMRLGASWWKGGSNRRGSPKYGASPPGGSARAMLRKTRRTAASA